MTDIDLEKLRSIGVISRQSRSVVKEGKREDGVRIKETTDELGNVVTEHATKDDRQDVLIRPKTIRWGGSP